MVSREAEEIAGFVFAVAAIVLLTTLAFFGLAIAVQMTWNMALPDIFGLPVITYRNAVGLVGLLFVARNVPSLSISKE